MRVAKTMVLAAVLVALWSCFSLAGDRGEVVQVCTCLGTSHAAEALAAKFRGVVPGLEVEIRPRVVRGREVYEVWARHPEMTPEGLCGELGRRGCAATRDDDCGAGL